MSGLRIAGSQPDPEAVAELARYTIQQISSGRERRADRLLDEAEKCLNESDGEAEERHLVSLVEDLGTYEIRLAFTPRPIGDEVGTLAASAIPQRVV